jgi:hypothetical protein
MVEVVPLKSDISMTAGTPGVISTEAMTRLAVVRVNKELC